MVRRWIIRSLFLLPLVCVVGVWVVSYFGGLILQKGLGREWVFFTVQGLGCMEVIDTKPPMDMPLDLSFHWSMTAKDLGTGPRTLGFYCGSSVWFRNALIIAFPLWLPTLLLMLLNWLVWRKSRPKPKGGAFPITPDPAASKAN